MLIISRSSPFPPFSRTDLDVIMTRSDGIQEDALITHQRDRHGEPLNAEVKPADLTASFITPIPKLFHRNHDDILHVPDVSDAVERDWKVSLSVDRDVIEQLADQAWVSSWREAGRDIITIPYGDILHAKGSCEGVEHLHATATMECAGNRRQDLAEDGKAEGIQWGPGAISTAHWQGASIRSILLKHKIADPYAHHANLAELQPSEKERKEDCAEWAQGLHLHMLSAQPTSESDQPQGEYFGASIPLSIAMHPQQSCILATSHNEQPLTRAHGYPLRCVIPGHLGARWVKWLRGLRVSAHEEDSPPMRLDYKLLTPPEGLNEEQRKRWLAKISGERQDEERRKREMQQLEPMQTLSVGSAIQKPSDGDALADTDDISVSGYAVGQDSSPVARVQVIALIQENEQESMSSLRSRAEAQASNRWTDAQVRGETADGATDLANLKALSWAWSLWEAKVSLPSDARGKRRTFALVARATTASGIEQEKDSPWNVRGFATRSWPVVRGLSITVPKAAK